MPPVRSRFILLLLLLLALSRVGVDAESPPLDDALAIESCVSRDAIRFATADERALLDDDDRAALHESMMARYPVLQRDGFQPSHIVLWRPPGAGWTYVSLLENPERPGQWCYTATFAADVFEITRRLLGKYFALRST